VARTYTYGQTLRGSLFPVVAGQRLDDRHSQGLRQAAPLLRVTAHAAPGGPVYQSITALTGTALRAIHLPGRDPAGVLQPARHFLSPEVLA